MDQQDNEPRGRGRPRKHQPSFNFKPPVYNSPLGYQYSQPVFFNVNISLPMPQVNGEKTIKSTVITKEDYSIEPRIKRKAAIKSMQSFKRKKKLSDSEDTEDNESYMQSSSDPFEGDPYEKLIDFKDGKYLVKFRNYSYLHCDWVDESEIAQTRTGSIKIKKFKKSEIPSEYLKIERILTEGVDSEDNDTVLVKWCGLPYEQSTIELISDVKNSEGFEVEYEKYKERKKMRHTSWPIDWRPDKMQQIKYTESYVYKNNNTLRPYQLEGINWLMNRWYWRQSCIMADEMGLGKTVQSVCFVEALSREFNYNHPVIVIAPLSTIVHWEREFAAWTNLRVLTYHGSIQGRDILVEYEFTNKTGNINVRLFDVILTTYEMVMAGQEHLSQFEYSISIIDEAHRLKNPNSKAAKSLRLLKINHKVLLTGTPIQNNLAELWALFNFIDSQRFNSLDNFLKEYKLNNSKDVDKLQALLKPLMLRRMKEDVETSIPAKEETIIEVELTIAQKRYYRAILEKNFEFLQSNSKKNVPNLINAMMELRKCCIHPYLLKGAEETIVRDYLQRKKINVRVNVDNMLHSLGEDLYYQILIQSSGKLVLLDKLLVKLQGKHKVLIFSQMTKCLDLLSEYLSYRKFKYERIDGSIRGDLRQAAIDRFSTEDSFVFLLCTRAGGVGINLTAADTCIIFDSDWNPQNDLQAQARCHRIGQKNQVKIYRLVTKNSYEREMFDKAGMKLGLDKAVLQKMSFMEGENTKDISEKDTNKGDAIQMLLRKGAYGVLMDQEDEEDKFCEEDIDQILERRTRIIRHEEGGNVFSKATFQVEEEVDDPLFWDNLLNSKKNVEKEGRVKRQCRKLARDGNINDLDEIQTLLDYYKNNNSSIVLNNEKIIKNLSIKEKELFIIFLEVLANGIQNIRKEGLFDLERNLIDNKVKELFKYCLDLINNEKLKLDFMEQMNDFIVPYDVELFELQSDIYLKYHEQFLFRIQIPVLINKIKNEISDVEKTRGFTKEDDKEIVDKILTIGYGMFKIKEKSIDEVNQRIRKILMVLYHKKDIKDYDNLYLKAILNFGRVTDLNKESVEKYIGRDTTNLEELIDKICNMTKRARKDTPEADCYDRIIFFDDLPLINNFNGLRKIGMPKNWTKEKDEELRNFLLVEGFSHVYDEFGITEDVAIKRMEYFIKNIK